MKLRFFLLFLPKLERLSTLYFSDPPHIYFDFLFSVWFTSNFLKFFYTNNNWTSFIIVWTRSRMIFLSPLISTFHHSPTAAIFFDFRWNSYYVQMGWSDPQRFASSSITHGTNVVHLFHVSLNVPSNLFFLLHRSVVLSNFCSWCYFVCSSCWLSITWKSTQRSVFLVLFYFRTISIFFAAESLSLCELLNPWPNVITFDPTIRQTDSGQKVSSGERKTIKIKL
jgi:hypothetical protein